MILSASAHANATFVALTEAPEVTWLSEVVELATAKRGGAALLTTLLDGLELKDAVATAISQGELWALKVNDATIGLALIRAGVISALYIVPAWRRQGLASDFVTTLQAAGVEVIDGLALPGDRATKSLYESLGWKARLLTMRSS